MANRTTPYCMEKQMNYSVKALLLARNKKLVKHPNLKARKSVIKAIGKAFGHNI